MIKTIVRLRTIFSANCLSCSAFLELLLAPPAPPAATVFASLPLALPAATTEGLLLAFSDTVRLKTKRLFSTSLSLSTTKKPAKKKELIASDNQMHHSRVSIVQLASVNITLICKQIYSKRRNLTDSFELKRHFYC